jgi:hypothetical protein
MRCASQPLFFVCTFSVTEFTAWLVLSYFGKWQSLCLLTCNNRLCRGACLVSRNIPELIVIVFRVKSGVRGRLDFYRL